MLIHACFSHYFREPRYCTSWQWIFASSMCPDSVRMWEVVVEGNMENFIQISKKGLEGQLICTFQVQNLCRLPMWGQCMKLKVKWRPQELSDNHIVDYLLRTVAGCGESQAKRESMWSAIDKAQGVGHPKPFRKHPSLPCVVYSVHRAMWPVSWLGFSFVLAPFLFPMSLFLPFGMSMFIVCHLSLDICNLLRIFTRAHSKEYALSFT